MAEHMDLPPHRLFRLAQLGHLEKAARSEAIWLCVSCYTCSARCPQSVRCVTIMDGLREMALRDGLVPAGQQRVLTFQRTFLDNVRRNGRLNELELVAWFKVAGFFKDYSMPLLFKDVLLVPRMVQRGKLSLSGKTVEDREVVERIFARCGFDPGPDTPEDPGL